MRRVMAVMMGCALTLATGTAAQAAWKAEMVDDEGGPVMEAYVETGAAEFPTELRLQCLGDSQFGVRYGVGSDIAPDAQLPQDGPVVFTFSVAGSVRKIPMQLEEMDGAFAAYLSQSDALFELLGGGDTLGIDDPTGLYHPVSFTLEGSRRAIDKLRKACR